MKITAEPRSDQWNADDFVGGARIFTIAGVKTGTAEQKYDIELAEGEGRSWRPPLTMLRLMIAAWGDESQQWVGRRVELYRDESIKFGPDAVGGIRIARMSHLPGDKRFSPLLTSSRGRRTRVSVDPLPDEPKLALITDDEAVDFGREIAESTTLDELNAIGQAMKGCDLGKHRDRLQAAWRERSAAIKAAAAPSDDGQMAMNTTDEEN